MSLFITGKDKCVESQTNHIIRALCLFSVLILLYITLASFLILGLATWQARWFPLFADFSSPNNGHIQFPGEILRALPVHPWTKHFGWWRVYSHWSTCLVDPPGAVSRVGYHYISLPKNTQTRQGVPLGNQRKEIEKCTGWPWSPIFLSFCSTILLSDDFCPHPCNFMDVRQVP